MNSVSDDPGTVQDEAGLYKWLPIGLWTIVGFATVAFLVSVASYLFQFGGDFAASHSRWGEFGDYLGGVLNPIVTLLGLLALLFTIVLQSRELRNSTRELATSARALKEQSASFKLQNFERTFFEMVRLHHDIIKDLDLVRSAESRTVGRDCFGKFFSILRQLHNEVPPELVNQERKIILDYVYSGFYKKNQHDVGHYFRNLHRILKFVDGSDVTNKTEYTGILRAQLSSFELVLLFYHALYSVGDKLKPLVERYAMLENLDLKLLFDPRNEVPLFSDSAYGEKDLTAELEQLKH